MKPKSSTPIGLTEAAGYPAAVRRFGDELTTRETPDSLLPHAQARTKLSPDPTLELARQTFLLGGLLVVICQVLFAGADYLLDQNLARTYPFYTLSAILGLVSAMAPRRRWFAQYWQMLGMAVVCLLMISAVNINLLKTNGAPIFLLDLMLINLGTAIFVPWGIVWQTAANLLSLVCFAYFQYAATAVDPNFVYGWLSLGTEVVVVEFAAAFFQRSSQRVTEYAQAVARTEVELDSARDAALIASRTKSAFIAGISYELRTPLNAILGTADLMEETKLSSEQHQLVELCRSNGQALLTLINEILDFSRMEAGELSLEATDFDLVEVVERAVDAVALSADQKNLELVCEILPDVPTALVGDPTRLAQVLLNLLDNAVKFTERGEIVVVVERDPSSRGPCHLRLSVSDSGIGIAAGRGASVFERFSQLGVTTNHVRSGGPGLGLAIARRLVGLMDGTIWYESMLGRGTTFYFTAQFGLQASGAASADIPQRLLMDQQILIIDDRATARSALRATLSAAGARVVEAWGVEKAQAELARANAAGHHFSTILLDYQLQGMDGFEAFHRICKDSPSRASSIFLMVGSAHLTAAIPKVRECGMAGYLRKPIRRRDLLEIAKYAPPAPSTPADAPTWTASHRALRILAAEDSKDARFLLGAYLRSTAHVLEFATNGREAVEMFTAKPFDLVLMDIQMPEMDGCEATRRIRRFEKENQLAEVEIIALTAHATAADQQRSLEAGCNLHLNKPVKKEILLHTISRVASHLRH